MECEIQIRTERLTLRPLVASDRDQIVQMLGDLKVTRWLTVVPHPYTNADFDVFLQYLSQASDLAALAIEEKGRVLGVVGLDPTADGPSLGYWLGRAHHGRGVMREAAQALIDYVFENEPDAVIVSGHFPGNAPSRAVLTHLGFRDTGDEDEVRCKARDCDEVVIKMCLTRGDWCAGRSTWRDRIHPQNPAKA